MKYIFCLNRKVLDNQKGLTLIEMVVVILIIATLATIAVAAFESWTTAKIETASQHFGQVMSASLQFIGRNSMNDFTSVSNANVQPFISGLALTGGVPWGGNYTAAPDAADARILQVTATAVPAAPGADIVTKLNSRGWTAAIAAGTITATKSL